MDSAWFDYLAGSHVKDSQLSISLPCCQHYIICLSIVTVKSDLTHSSSVGIYCLKWFRSVYIPEGKPTGSITWYSEWVAPRKFHYSISMSIEKTLDALESIELPDK